MSKNTYLVMMLALMTYFVSADIYMHSICGSNNRLNNPNNNQQNRLFDSQNNAAGGCLTSPHMTFYSGSLLQIEWTSQHGCGVGHPNVDCNVVIQYMCGPDIRDGTENERIDIEATGDDLLKYGLHEPIEYYKNCQYRERNKGLFTSNLRLGNGAISTRQNRNGNRQGTECTEERDYYPYWHPSPFKDIAILTSKTSRCGYYRSNSQNVVSKGHCVKSGSSTGDYDLSDPSTHPTIWSRYPEYDEKVDNDSDIPKGYVPNNKQECESAGHVWEEVPSWGISAPECLPTFYARDNHLGNSNIFGKLSTNVYRWKIPNMDPNDKTVDREEREAYCVVRIRYNISTEDFEPFGELDGKEMVDASHNDKYWNDDTPTYPYGTNSNGEERYLTLTMNRNQYARTFQDRTHMFAVKERPSTVPKEALIYNVIVRGRRGNIVQAYPSVEHDFSPTYLELNSEDYIHLQWTGANNQNGAGNGRNGYERHNIVFIKDNDPRKNTPEDFDKVDLFDEESLLTMAYARQPDHYCSNLEEQGCCLTEEQIGQVDKTQDLRNCNYLNAAPQDFQLLVKPRKTGVFHYMSTRNNNFTNRSHKGTFDVRMKLSPVTLAAVVMGSVAFIVAAVLAVGVFVTRGSDGGGFFQKVKI